MSPRLPVNLCTDLLAAFPVGEYPYLLLPGRSLKRDAPASGVAICWVCRRRSLWPVCSECGGSLEAATIAFSKELMQPKIFCV